VLLAKDDASFEPATTLRLRFSAHDGAHLIGHPV